MNIAFPPDVAEAGLDVVASSVARVEAHYDYGMIDFSYLKNCVGFLSSGEFKWQMAANPRAFIHIGHP